MREFGKVSARFWVDSEMETLSDDGKLLALYLLTTHHGNLLGIFRMPMGYIATDLKWDMEKTIQTFDELETKRFAKRSSNGDLIVINNYTKHNRTENNRQLDARLRLVLTLPENLDDLLPEAANVIDGIIQKACAGEGSSETEQLLEQIHTRYMQREEKVRLEKREERREKREERSIDKIYVRSDDQTTKRHDSSAESSPLPMLKTKPYDSYPEDFIEWWNQYPKREGDKGHKKQTFGKYKKRLADGHSPESLLANILNYARYCDETGATGTQYVKTTVVYLNNPDNLTNQWTVNYEARQRHSGKLSLVEQVEQANAHILQPGSPGAFSGTKAFSGTEAFSGGNIYDVESERSGDAVFDHDGPVRPEVDQCLRSG
ncbi:hypothetical protein [Endozoicomonas sp. SCSIO W0465]|uniref:hypothetical protein n=1 Tax=Endozoicomonas sp. SCSIO W0465 TaxID=2918516 RepID=UPI0020753C9D|nr:hypothetical protein [Endozoicomonas sp. SCSIO W0465]USE35898.1 hypothetical protein MJO57_28185 [Endozoicomonas sp. SCSIO W0465]